MKAVACLIGLVVILLVPGNVAATNRTFVIELENIRLSVARIEVDLNDNVSLVIYNNESNPLVLHDFHLGDFGITITSFGGGQVRYANFTANKAGSFQYACHLVGHESMRGTLVVRNPNARTPGPEFLVLTLLAAMVVTLVRARGKR